MSLKVSPVKDIFSFDISIKNLCISNEEKAYPITLAIRSTEFQTENFIKMKWDGEDTVNPNKESDPINLTFPLKLKEELDPDADIFGEMFTNTKNSVGLPSPNRSGESFVSYRNLKDLATSKETNKIISANISYHQAETAGKVENKGQLLIKLQNYDSLSKIKFKKVENFHYVKENYKTIEDALKRRGKVDEYFLKKYPPSVKELENVAIPFQISMVAPVPAEGFWVDNRKFIPYEEREEVAHRKLKAVLNRDDMTEEHFNSIIESQFKTSKLHPEMRKVCKILANVCTLNANNWYYKADEGFIQNKKVGVEDFLSINRLAQINGSTASGDCEDSAKSAFDTFRAIQEDIYKTDIMKNLQRVSKEFVVIGSLASVEGQKVEDADGKRKDVFVGDNTNIKTGAHMFSMAIPTREFEKLVENGSEKSKLKFPKSKLHPDIHLFKLVLEGTGAISPLIFPESSYSTTKEEFIKEKVYHENLLSVINTFEKKTIGISYGSRPRIPSRPVDKSNLLPQFYRYIRNVFVGKALGNINGDAFFVCTNENESGVDIRSIFLSDNIHADLSKEHFTPFKFVMVPRPNDFDAKIFERLKSQLPLDPGELPVKVNISANVSSPGGVNIYSTLNNFNEKCEKIAQPRKKSKNETMNYTVSYKNTEVFDMMHKDKKLIEIIGQEVLDNDFIVSAKGTFNQISNISSFVDIKFVIDLDRLKKKESSSLIKDALISNRLRFREEEEEDDDDIFFEEDDDEDDDEYENRRFKYSKEQFGSSFINFSDKKLLGCGMDSSHPHGILYHLIKELEGEQLRAKISNPVAFLTPGYGYSFFLYVLRMEHVKKMLNAFLSSTHEKGVFVPFLDEDTLMELKQEYDLYDHSLHDKVIKDHFFIMENYKIVTLGEYLYSKKAVSLSTFDDMLRVKSKHGENEYEIYKRLKIDGLDAYFIDGVIDL